MINTFEQIDPKQERSGLSSIFILLGVFLIFLVIGNFIGMLVLFAFPDFSIADGLNILGYFKNSPYGWWAITLMQGISSFIIFIGTFWTYWYLMEKKKIADLNFQALPKPKIIGFVLLLQVISAPFVSYLGELNEKVELPTSMSLLENSLKNMESQAAELTEIMTNFTGFFQFIMAFLVIAVIAGLGEELVFRGLLERKLYLINFNPHLAIWVSAIIFSAIHFQFYGFLPRLFLGVFFGYTYYWTGNIFVTIIAHIFNNGVIVFLNYLINTGLVDKSVENIEKMPLFPTFISFLLFVVGAYFLKQQINGTQNGHIQS